MENKDSLTSLNHSGHFYCKDCENSKKLDKNKEYKSYNLHCFKDRIYCLIRKRYYTGYRYSCKEFKLKE